MAESRISMEEEKLFRIGDVAKMFHISTGTLRHYERIGIVVPEFIEEKSSYRYYGIRQFEVLNTIRYLRVLDMPLEQIADFLANRDIQVIEEKLQNQKEMIREKKRQLEVIERKIDHRIHQIQDAASSKLDAYDRVFLVLDDEENYQGEVEQLPDTLSVSIRFCGGHQEAEKYYRKLLSYIKEHQLKIAGFSREITLIDYGITNDTGKFVTEILIPVCEN